MNWEMIGAIGEIVGALGVIVTLGYLAKQIRSNTIAMRREAERETFDGVRLVLGQIATDRDLARVFRTGLAGMENLDPDEQTQFGAYLLATTYNWLRVHSYAKDLTFEPDLAEAVSRSRHDIAATPGFQQWFETRKHWLPREFREQVESDIAAGHREFVPLGGRFAGSESSGPEKDR